MFASSLDRDHSVRVRRAACNWDLDHRTAMPRGGKLGADSYLC